MFLIPVRFVVFLPEVMFLRGFVIFLIPVWFVVFLPEVMFLRGFVMFLLARGFVIFLLPVRFAALPEVMFLFTRESVIFLFVRGPVALLPTRWFVVFLLPGWFVAFLHIGRILPIIRGLVSFPVMFLHKLLKLTSEVFEFEELPLLVLFPVLLLPEVLFPESSSIFILGT